MENAENQTKISTFPVPKPRNIFLKKTEYENVSISNENSTNDKKVNRNIIIESSTNNHNETSNITETKESLNEAKIIYNIPNKHHNIENLSGSKLNDDSNIEQNNEKISEECKVYNKELNNIYQNDISSCDKFNIFKPPTNYAVNLKTFECANKEYDSVFVKKRNDSPNNIFIPSNTTSVLTSRASTPEPFYANQQDQFLENQNFFNINFENDNKFHKPVEKEVLYEFDPLMRQRNSTSNEISNQLLLLQNILQDDVYSNAFGGIPFSSMTNDEISDEDNVSDSIFLPPLPTRVDSLEFHSNENSLIDYEGTIDNSTTETSESQGHAKKIVGKKLNESLKLNIDSENSSKPQSSWYIKEPGLLNDETTGTNFDETPPPPYSENANKNPFHKSLPSVNDIKTFSINGKTEINKMISNFYNKMSVLKRKNSLKSKNPIITADNFKKFEIIPRPRLTQTMVRHEGFLIRFPSGTIEDIFKEFQNRKAILRDSKFLAYQESELKTLKEAIPLNQISTIQCVSNSKVTEHCIHYCFEITTIAPKVISQQKLLSSSSSSTNKKNQPFKAQRLTHLYGISKESERDLWMQKLLESLTDVFPSNITCKFYRAGWCYLKKSITTEWSGAWIMLSKRKRRLFIYIESEGVLEKLDLRKARCIVMKELDNSIENLYIEQGPILMIDCPPFSLYLIMSCSRETKIWKHIIREVSCNNGPGLDEQQLTKHNVPVIIDKCINFIYIHGSMSEGIYRKSGSENNIQKLIYDFRSNAFSVEITKSEYNEHDVANVLKRFLRFLPKRLLGKLSESFHSVSQMNSLNDKIISYKELFSRLSSIELMTIKKLISHLSFIESQSSHNKMTIENLAVIWGPTLLVRKGGVEDSEYNQQEAQVMKDLILNYKNLFPLTKDEINKEKSMLMYLKKYYAASDSLNELTVKQSGDLKVWVTLNLSGSDCSSQEEQNSICVVLNPTKNALDVCKEIANKIKRSEKELCLFEVIFNNNLKRPINDDEKIFHTVLRWSFWPEEGRKDNHIEVKTSQYFDKMQRTLKKLKSNYLTKSLYYADNKSKTFKLYEVEINGTRLTINKITKNGMINYKKFDLRNFKIYLDTERKVNFVWALTLIENNQDSNLKHADSHFPGHVLAGNNKEDQIIVFSNLWNNLYGDNKIS